MDERIYEKLSVISSKIARIDVTLERNTKDVEKHILRTDLLEKKIAKAEAIIWFLGGIMTVVNIGISIWSKM